MTKSNQRVYTLQKSAMNPILHYSVLEQNEFKAAWNCEYRYLAVALLGVRVNMTIS